MRGVAPVRARGAVGLEAEVVGRRLRGEHGALVQDDEAAIEQFPELDATAGVGALVGAGRELGSSEARGGPCCRGRPGAYSDS